MIRGIGPVYAEKLLRAFGEKVFDGIEAEPDRLREVDGIGPVRAGRIVAAWVEQKVVREIMVFLDSHGVGAARAVQIYKTYGVDAVQVVSADFVVMGGHGHSRLREFILGGATRGVLSSMTIPTLMSHPARRQRVDPPPPTPSGSLLRTDPLTVTVERRRQAD